ncbi:MAG TPA: hypothetical protein VK753_07255 [Xanthomonadaceae bacterium]|jgi:hypothetical protein|nr:hypothetical protein [Xanthomonadaceae bacterium]
MNNAAALAIVLTCGLSSTSRAGDANSSPGHGPASVSPAPGFDCARAKSNVEHLICSSPDLSRLDAQLGDIFSNASGQAGLDPKALRHDEDVWLSTVRGACTDVACLESAYAHRIEALKNQSLQAASPAAYAQTRPFPVDPSTLAHVRGFIGQSCDILMKPSPDLWSGFSPIKGFMPVIAAGASVRPMMRDQSRFAFLTTDTDDGGCRISDVVVLPDPGTANAFLQCDSPIPDDAARTGVGMRLVGDRKVVAYWAIDTEHHVLERLPLGVLGVENSMHCREPETGE